MLILGLTQYRRLCTGIGFSRLLISTSSWLLVWHANHADPDLPSDAVRIFQTPGQPSLGSSPHSRRIAEDWNRGVASHGRQVHGPASEAALPDMANLSQESRQGLGFCRLLRGPDDYLPTPIRLCDSRP